VVADGVVPGGWWQRQPHHLAVARRGKKEKEWTKEEECVA